MSSNSELLIVLGNRATVFFALFVLFIFIAVMFLWTWLIFGDFWLLGASILSFTMTLNMLVIIKDLNRKIDEALQYARKRDR